MDRRFLLLALAGAFNFNAFFLYIVSAPALLPSHLGLGPQEYAWLFVPSIGGIMVGALLSGQVAGKWSFSLTIRRGYDFMVAAALVNLGYCLWFPPALPWTVLPVFFYAIGSALAFPSLSLAAMDLFPTRRGMASSLQGFVGGMLNALVAGLVSPALSHSPLGLSLGMLCLMTCGLACWLLSLRSGGRDR